MCALAGQVWVSFVVTHEGNPHTWELSHRGVMRQIYGLMFLRRVYSLLLHDSNHLDLSTCVLNDLRLVSWRSVAVFSGASHKRDSDTWCKFSNIVCKCPVSFDYNLCVFSG
jgi:hypothetical protein